MTAASSAITGYDETSPDLLCYIPAEGKYEYLKDDEGLLRIYAYYHETDALTGAAEGYLKSTKIRKGQLGDDLRISEILYTQRTVDDISIFPTWKQISYRDEDDGGSNPITIEFDYSWYEDSFQIKQRTTILPVVPTEQNGSGVADTRKDYFDVYGNLTWSMDERGYIIHFEYNLLTGALTKKIDDVDTDVVTGAPSGWTTPAGGGLNLVTDLEHDDLGRITQELGPKHYVALHGSNTMIRRARWIVYQDVAHERWDGAGYGVQNVSDYDYTLINPVTLIKFDSSSRVTDQIKAVRGSTTGKLLPTDSFPQSSWVRWSKASYAINSDLTDRKVYYLIPSSGGGTSGVNYNQTDYGYNQMRSLNRMRTPGGTIVRTVFQVMGWPTETWVGTDDTGATASNPGGSGSPNNMVKTQANEYDDGHVGGNGNLTKVTQYVNASDVRVTAFDYDFRNRKVVTDGEVDFYETTEYDNQSNVIRVDRRDTDAEGNLIGRTETLYDNRGRTYQTIAYGVDPETGTIGNSLINNTWFDGTNNAIKRLDAGSKAFSKKVFDGIGRLLVQYTAIDADESGYTEAGSIEDDIVMRQIEVAYDDASNIIQSTTRERFDNATGTGPLTTPDGDQPKARVYYAANWPDPLGRKQASANYGTNGGSALSRPATIPGRSDTVLVNSWFYNSQGELFKSIDPKSIVTLKEFDEAGRVVKLIEDYHDESSSSSSSSSSLSSSSSWSSPSGSSSSPGV